jgi:hypothetical protein
MDCPIRMKAADFYEAWAEECRRKDEELLAFLLKRELDIYTVTVADKARLFTVKERERADRARTFVQNSGFRDMGK